MRALHLLGAAAGFAVAGWASAAFADVTITIDASANVHPISPLIYGVNFPTAAQLATKAVTVMRRGGNSTSRYNYQVDFHNTGSDYFFENIPDCPGCSNAKDQSSANAFLQQAASNDLVALFTMPTIGTMPKAGSPQNHPYACGYPKTISPNQECYDQYDTNCGDGRTGGACNAGKTWVTAADVSATSDTADADFEKGWAAYLVGKFGASNGKRIYELDNEPALWSSTHHDVRPQHLSYDELWQRMSEYAAAIAEADPTAAFAGPVEWGWPNYLCSDVDTAAGGCSATSPDRAAHGGEELVAWLLDQAKAYEQTNGRRILHYLDLHYYPQGGNAPDNTRSLWDPGYTDPSWINATIRLIPRMRDWVSGHYPGTKLSISEFDFGNHDSAIGAVTYADVLGIFGREGLDMATAWGSPDATQTAFSAYKLFRNYDGNGAHFESTSVGATIAGTGVQAFAASSTTRLTVVLVNESAVATTARLSLSNFTAGTSASVYSNDGTANISHKANAAVTGGKMSIQLAPTSIDMVVFSGSNPNPSPEGGTGSGGAPSGASGAPSAGGSASTGGAPSGGNDNGGAASASTGGASSRGSGASAGFAGAGQTEGDASTQSGSGKSGGKSGCSCRAASSDSKGHGAPAFIALVFAVARRRRGRA